MKSVVLCVLLGLVLAVHDAQSRNAVSPCGFDLTFKNKPNHGHSAQVKNVETPFITHENINGDNFEDYSLKAVMINRLELSSLNNIQGVFNLTGSARCVLLDAGKRIKDTQIEGYYLNGLHLKSAYEISEVKVKGKAITDLHLDVAWEVSANSPSGTIWFNEITGEIIERVHARASYFTQNSIKAVFVNDVNIEGFRVTDNKIVATSGAYNTTISGTHKVYATDISSYNIEGVDVNSQYINDTTIKGIYISDASLYAKKFIYNTHIEGHSVKDLRVLAETVVNNVFLRAQSLENVFVGAGHLMNAVDIRADYFDNVNIRGSLARAVSNVRINGIFVEKSGSYSMQCSNKYAHPDEPEFNDMNKCFSPYCQLSCRTKGWDSGKCFDHTCCCATA